MFEKTATYTVVDAKPLSVPDMSNSFFVDQKLEVEKGILASTINNIKTASKVEADKEIDGDNTEFDLEAEINSHPKSLYVKCFAIKADETNDNGDHFAYDELKKATATFVGVPVFTNHENTDAEKARGKVVHSWWDEDQNGIMIIARVDSEAYPQLARGIREKYIEGTSMGCQVHHSLCSICHNFAETPDEYCTHIKERKTRKISAKNIKCEYHKHGDEEECPLCGCKKGETNKFAVDDLESFEYNYGIKFIENSFVVNPACHDCGVTEVVDSDAFLKKVAEWCAKASSFVKEAATKDVMCDDKKCVKIAGQAELDQLNQAIETISSVSQTMLQQKDQIDLEFLSDLVTVLSDLQTVTDELAQQGYGRLPSVGETAEGVQGEVTNAVDTGQTPQLQPVNPTPGGGSKVHSGPAGEAGSVTTPFAKRRIDLAKVAAELLLKRQDFKKTASKSTKKQIKIPFKFSK